MHLLIACCLAVLATTHPRAGADRSGAPPAPSPPAGGQLRYSAPVTPLHLVRGFEPPASRYGAGHRGVDLATRSGAPVAAASTGRVTFAGRIAGRGLVVITHPDGVRTEYEPLAPSVRAGQTVARGQPIGRVYGTHGTCAPGRCLHWGARRGEQYFDPLTLLRSLGPVRLLPWSAVATA